MAKAQTCDRCGKPIERAVLKLFLSPTSLVPTNGKRKPSDHSNYTGHADIGECCYSIVLREIKWQKRRKVPRKKPVNA